MNADGSETTVTGALDAPEAFTTIESATNKNAPFVARTSGDGYYSGQANQSFKDQHGRYFHAGVRFKM